MLLTVVLQTVHLSTSSGVRDASRLVHMYCAMWGLLLKTMNFSFKVKEIFQMKQLLREIIDDENVNENSEAFIKNVKRGFNCFR